MTINTAHTLFETLESETSKKSELKVYTKFLHILSELKTRDFSEGEIKAVEKELDSLALEANPKNRKRYYTKALNKFETYLKDIFSLTTSGYYTPRPEHAARPPSPARWRDGQWSGIGSGEHRCA